MSRILLLFTLLLWIAAKSPVEGHPLLYPENNAYFPPPVTAPYQDNHNTISSSQNTGWMAFISETQPSVPQYFSAHNSRNYKNGLQYKLLCSLQNAPHYFYHFYHPAHYISGNRYANGFYLHFLKKLII